MSPKKEEEEVQDEDYEDDEDFDPKQPVTEQVVATDKNDLATDFDGSEGEYEEVKDDELD